MKPPWPLGCLRGKTASAGRAGSSSRSLWPCLGKNSSAALPEITPVKVLLTRLPRITSPDYGLEQRAMIGSNIALDMPRRSQILAWLRGGPEIEVHKAQINDGSAVELCSGGLAEIRREDDFLPRAGAAGGRRELIALDVEVDELQRKKVGRCRACLVRARHQGIKPWPCWMNRFGNACCLPVLV